MQYAHTLKSQPSSHFTWQSACRDSFQEYTYMTHKLWNVSPIVIVRCEFFGKIYFIIYIPYILLDILSKMISPRNLPRETSFVRHFTCRILKIFATSLVHDLRWRIFWQVDVEGFRYITHKSSVVFSRIDMYCARTLKRGLHSRCMRRFFWKKWLRKISHTLRTHSQKIAIPSF